MIHVWDQDFKDKVEESFHEAYMTHTSTSPNYQILASLDVGRRQVELEGYELIQRQLELAMSLREQVLHHPLLKRYFRFLRVSDYGARALPRIRCRQLLQRRDRLGQPGSGVADRRVRARSDPRHADHRRHRHGRRHVQEQGADGPVRHPDQQDLAQHGVVHDEHRQHPLGDRLPDRSAGQDRPRRGRARGRYELHRTAHPRTAGALADAGAAAAAGLLQLSLRLPGPQRGRTRRDARRRYPQRLLPVLRGRQLRVHRHGRGRPGHRRRPRAGVGAVRDPLPARLSHPGARPGHQRRDPAVHGRAGCARDPRLPARAGLPHLQPGRAGPGRAGHRRPRGPGAGRTRRPVAGRRPARADRTGACRHGVPAAKKPVSRSKK